MADQSADSFKMQERIKAERSSSGPHNVPSWSQNGKERTSQDLNEWQKKFAFGKLPSSDGSDGLA